MSSIAPEIAMSPTSAQLGALAEAEICPNDGDGDQGDAVDEAWQHLLLRIAGSEGAVDILAADVPAAILGYADGQCAKERAGCEPGGAALIRQESEFNPEAVSRANAYGLIAAELPTTALDGGAQTGREEALDADAAATGNESPVGDGKPKGCTGPLWGAD